MNQPVNNQSWAAFARGDAETWRQLLGQQIPRLYGLFLKSWPNPSLAEELVAKTVFDAVRGLATYETSRGSPENWLFGIAHNNARQEIRRRASRPTVDGDISDYIGLMDTRTLPDEVLERAETAELVRTALARLDDRERQALVAKYIEDLPARLIAERLSITEKAVHSLLFRARCSLREQLKRMASDTEAKRK